MVYPVKCWNALQLSWDKNLELDGQTPVDQRVLVEAVALTRSQSG